MPRWYTFLGCLFALISFKISGRGGRALPRNVTKSSGFIGEVRWLLGFVGCFVA